MNHLTQTLITALLVIAVFGAGFIATTHTHQHAGDSDAVATCDCGHEHDTNSEAPLTPCEHDDCHLCKFLNSYAWVSVPPLDLHSQNDFQLLSIDQAAFIRIAAAAAYLGRAPPTV